MLSFLAAVSDLGRLLAPVPDREFLLAVPEGMLDQICDRKTLLILCKKKKGVERPQPLSRK
jgi:hypothetical protein